MPKGRQHAAAPTSGTPQPPRGGPPLTARQRPAEDACQQPAIRTGAPNVAGEASRRPAGERQGPVWRQWRVHSGDGRRPAQHAQVPIAGSRARSAAASRRADQHRPAWPVADAAARQPGTHGRGWFSFLASSARAGRRRLAENDGHHRHRLGWLVCGGPPSGVSVACFG